MIWQHDKIFLLNTEHTSYLFSVLPTGQMEHLYYGALLPGSADDLPQLAAALSEKREFAPGNAIVYSQADPALSLEDVCLEMSSYGKGDVREPFTEITWPDGSSVCDFLYESAAIRDGKEALKTLPSSYGEAEDGVMTLTVTLREKHFTDTVLKLLYTVFPSCDVIVRSSVLAREGHRSPAQADHPVIIRRLMSAQLDFPHVPFRMSTFGGHWTREMQKNETLVSSGRFVNESVCGVSSNRANPFVMLESVFPADDPGFTGTASSAALPSFADASAENSGECFGCNLIYSGNHYESLSVSGFFKSRFVTGIQPGGFSWTLRPGETFEAPEAVLTFSDRGRSLMSRHMHDFIRRHIVRGRWAERERPVLINSWEADYMKFTESSLLKLAREAKNEGIELFVLDDGWFGTRNDDRQSLGDWTVNLKKLPGGLRGLSEKITAMGLLFGIWVEPEMVNENSELFRAHPDYAVSVPGREQSLGRNQMILDLTRDDVCDFIIESMKNVFGSGKISYVKWDMNRIFSDAWSAKLPASRQGEFYHRYVMGLYRIMKTLTDGFPDILFEGCASGGCRFDLGILCSFPQIWGSDDSDALMRASIQRGYSYGYPASVIGAHVSACPNHQTMRVTPLETRFQVAAFGAFGYELNLCELPEKEKTAVREQVEFYKKWRSVFLFGDYCRLPGGRWMAVSKDRKMAAGVLLRREMVPNSFFDEFRTAGLDENALYRVSVRAAAHDVEDFGSLINAIAPVHIRQDSLVHHAVGHFVKLKAETEDCLISGAALNRCGIRLRQGYGAVGFNERVRIMKDFDSRMYLFERQG